MSKIVPINDLARYANEVSGRLRDKAAEVLKSGYYVLGPNVREFEERFAGYCGVSHCIGVGNGTDALEIALRAVGVQQGDCVLVAANAAMYGTSAVLAVGAEPVFVDVSASGAYLEPEAVDAMLQTLESAPAAVIVTHLYGRLAPMQAIVELCTSRGIAVIEDCAQAHGATAPDGAKAGSHGDAATFSFYPTKNLGAVGDGGAVTCADATIAGRARQLRQYGWSSKYTNELPGGRNSRLDELQAAFLLSLLPDLDRRNDARRVIANRYSREIVHPAIWVPAAAGAEFVAHLYVVRSKRRDALVAHLRNSGISCEVHYPLPDHLQPCHQGRFVHYVLPETQAWCDEALTLPCFPELTSEEVDRVIAACNAWSVQQAGQINE
ncbi:MAG: DegT/DnrJ/EryC1/StrS family aminotransferase [Thermomonas sp.]